MKHHVLRWAQLCVAAAAGVMLTSSVNASPEKIVVKRGETIESLAQKHGVTERAIARANDISVDTDLRKGRRLVIPDPPRASIKPATMRRAAVVEADRVTLRSGPDEDRRKITLLDSGVRLIATRRAGDWFQVRTEEGDLGWIREDLIRVGKELPEPKRAASKPKAKTVKLQPVRTAMILRKGAAAPRVSHRRAMPMYPRAVVSRGSAPRRLAQGSVDVRPEEPSASDLPPVGVAVELAPVVEPPDRRSNRAERLSRGAESTPAAGVIRTAFGYRGVPYRFGGTTRRGIDCSAFVGAVYRAHGVSLPRTAREQFTRGEKIPFEEMEAGDLVFFHTTRAGISHVGMYLGSGKFVHASSSGGGVRVDSITEGYYRKRFRGARRVKKSPPE